MPVDGKDFQYTGQSILHRYYRGDDMNGIHPHDPGKESDFLKIFLSIADAYREKCKPQIQAVEEMRSQLDCLPEVLTPKHIKEYLLIHNTKLYDLLGMKPEAGGIKCFRVGRSIRIYKTDFMAWLNKKRQDS